jgi:ATP-dependent DNA helicase RecQ
VVGAGALARKSLRLQTIAFHDQAERLAWLAANVPALPGSGIVYCLTSADCERVASWLASCGVPVAGDHGGLPGNRVKALVTTIAPGRGFDRHDLGFVIHFQRPWSPVAYYQKLCCADRALDDAYVVLLHSREDDQIVEYLIPAAFPSEADLRAVLGALEANDGLTVPELEARLNLARARIEQCLDVLETDGATVRERGCFVRSANPWEPDLERIANATAQRRRELARMQDLTHTKSCLMEFLRSELDEPAAAPCGRCAVCAGDFLPRGVDPALRRAAVRFLRRAYRVIEPRKRWPFCGVGDWRGTIRPELQAEEGCALSIYGDAGWGLRVGQAKFRRGRFDDQLVEAAAELVEDVWQPDPASRWVTAIPSLRTDIVPEFGRRLAERLGLPYRAALVKMRDNAPQKLMRNSHQQARNVAEAVRVDVGELVDGPVLLVDDIVDSRWSMTVSAALLREAGSGAVYPLALASAPI